MALGGLAEILMQLEQATRRPDLGRYMSAPIHSYGSPNYSKLSPQQPPPDVKALMGALFPQNKSPVGQYVYGNHPLNFDQLTPRNVPDFAKDEEWAQTYNDLKEDYRKTSGWNISDKEFYDMMFKESSFLTGAISPENAVGLFQIMPKTLDDLNVWRKKHNAAPIEGRLVSSGTDTYTPEDILNMKPADQLKLYADYMRMKNFNPQTQPLALLQAAPAYLPNFDKLPPDTVIYKKNSRAWEKNPGWRSANNGPITLGSLMAFYGR